MKKKENIIRSHGARVKAAKVLIANDPTYSKRNISIFDREAFVETFLLEDLFNFYQNSLDAIQNSAFTTRRAEELKRIQAANIKAILKLLASAFDVARLIILEGSDLSLVWKSIPEHVLMHKATKQKQLDALREIVKGIQGDLFEKARLVGVVVRRHDEDDLDLKSEDNYRRMMQGLDTREKYIESMELNEAEDMTTSLEGIERTISTEKKKKELPTLNN